MKLRILSFSIILFLLAPATYADYYDLNLLAPHLKILIKNDTSSDCTLNYTTLNNGADLTPSISPVLRKGEPAIFVLYGFTKPIDYVVSYRCGNKNITLNNHRNRTILAGGRVKGNVVTEKSDRGITATLEDIRRGSAFFELNAYMVWSLNTTR